MATRGLCVGGLPSLEIRGGRFTSVSKGKGINGELPKEARRAIASSLGLDHRTPFKGMSSTNLAVGFKYYVDKLYAAGKLRARYSVHDLRRA
jgi:hypothetical protein